MIVYHEARSRGEGVKDIFKIDDMSGNGMDDDEGVISVLENQARKVVDQRVEEESIPGGMEEQLLKDIGYKIKKGGREGVALVEDSSTLNPFSRNPIEEHSRLARAVNALD